MSPPILFIKVFIAASAIPDPCAFGVILNIVAAVPKLALLAPTVVPAATMLSLPEVATFCTSNTPALEATICSVNTPVVAFLDIVLKPFSDRTGPLKVVFAF